MLILSAVNVWMEILVDLAKIVLAPIAVVALYFLGRRQDRKDEYRGELRKAYSEFAAAACESIRVSGDLRKLFPDARDELAGGVKNPAESLLHKLQVDAQKAAQEVAARIYYLLLVDVSEARKVQVQTIANECAAFARGAGRGDPLAGKNAERASAMIDNLVGDLSQSPELRVPPRRWLWFLPDRV